MENKNKKEGQEIEPVSGAISLTKAGRPAPARVFLFGFFFFLISILPFSFAQGGSEIPITGSLFAAQSAYGPLIPLIIIGLATMSFVAALGFMISQIFRTGEVEMQAKTEVYHVIVTVIWALFLFSAATTVDQVSRAYTGGTLFDGAQGYLSQVTCLSAVTSIKMEGYKMGLQYLSGMKSRYYAGPWGFSFPTYPGFEVIERAMDLMQMFIIPFTSSLYVQSMGLDIIRAGAMTLLMPAGILMRLFPPTRQAAGFMMAAAFGLYFVLPFTYIIGKEVMEPLYSREFGRGMCGQGAGTTIVGSSGTRMADSLALNLWPSLSRDILKFPASISYLAMQSVFLPSLSMIITVTFIRSSTRFFGQGME